MTKVWRCLLFGTKGCRYGQTEACIWRPGEGFQGPLGCYISANIIMDHVEKVTA